MCVSPLSFGDRGDLGNRFGYLPLTINDCCMYVCYRDVGSMFYDRFYRYRSLSTPTRVSSIHILLRVPSGAGAFVVGLYWCGVCFRACAPLPGFSSDFLLLALVKR